ncbi:MAG: sigma-70 family RNA polymerase sigma factor [bacterium]
MDEILENEEITEDEAVDAGNLVKSGSGDEYLPLFRIFHDTRQQNLRDKLVNAHMHLVNSVTRRFTGIGESQEDLAQEGAIGLLNAVNLFNPDREVKFSTYAIHLITSQIQHYLRDRGRLIRQPAWIQELNSKINKAADKLSQQAEREVTEEEIAREIAQPVETVHSVIAAQDLNHIMSLNVSAEGDDNPQNTLEKNIIAELWAEPDALPMEDRMLLEEAMGQLKDVEQNIVRLYYFGGYTQAEIAGKINVTINYVSYILRRSVSKIRNYLDEERLREAAALMEEKKEEIHVENVGMIYDPMTRLYSNGYMRARIAEEVLRSQRYLMNFALLMIEIDFIDNINNISEILNTVVNLLKNSVRGVDIVGHLGSGKFCLLLPHTGLEAKVLSDRICNQIKKTFENGIAVKAFAGYSVFPLDGVNEAILFDRTENALRTAHVAGPFSTIPAGSVR